MLRYALAAAMLPLGAFMLAMTTSLVLARTDPVRATAIYPTADAMARLAEQTAFGSGSAPLAESYALRSLRRMSVNPRAAAVLAVLAAKAGDSERSERLFRYSESMSRRYVPTQLGLLEIAVQAGKVKAALVHYDRAMRVSLESRMTLFPILVQASMNPNLRPKVARLMAASNSWKSSFLDRLIGEGTDPTTIAVLVAAAKLDSRDPVGSRQLTSALSKLVAAGAYRQADYLFKHACSGTACSSPIVNGTFESDNRFAPFGWEMLTEGTEVTTVDARNHVLEFADLSGGPGARQLLQLASGTYAIDVSANVPTQASAITLTLRCATSNVVIGTMALARSGQFRLGFSVPGTCPYQWLILSQAPHLDRDLNPAWIDNIAVARNMRNAFIFRAQSGANR